jgi:hypothetical protein
MKKASFRVLVLLLLMTFFSLPAFAQEGEETETVPTEAALVEEVVLNLDGEPWYVAMTVWGGWLAAAMFAGVAFYFAKDAAAKGNKVAELGLNFFEASKDMIPFDKYQYQFEQMSRRSANPIDNIVSAATGAIGNELGLLNRTGVGESAIDGVPHEAQSR